MAAAAVGGCAASTCHTSMWCGDGSGNGAAAMQQSSSRRCPRFLVRGRVQVHSSAATCSANQQESNLTPRNERQRAAARFGVAADVSRCYSTTPCRPCHSSPTRGSLCFAKSGCRRGMRSTSSSSLSSSSASSIAVGIPTLLAEDGSVTRHLSEGGGMLSRCSLSSLSARSLKRGVQMLSVDGESAAELRRWWRASLIGRKERIQQRTYRFTTRHHHHRRFARGMAMAATESAPVMSGKENKTMSPPYNVLITGSTKGVGYALAKEFLQAGDNVIICSRSDDRVEQVCKELRERFGDKKVWGKACNVADAKDVEKLALFAKEKLGYVDLWINNAGTNGYEAKALIDMSDEVLTEVVTTNMLGVIICCREGIRLMRNQKRGGHIFNMDGAGVDGNATPRYSAYGATKRSLAQFTKTLQAELKTLGIKNVIVHNLSPGMVQTDLLMSGVNTPSAKFFVNVLAEPAATVADYLVPRLRKVPTTAGGQSTYIRFLTKPRAYLQIILRLLFKMRKDRFVKEDS